MGENAMSFEQFIDEYSFTFSELDEACINYQVIPVVSKDQYSQSVAIVYAVFSDGVYSADVIRYVDRLGDEREELCQEAIELVNESCKDILSKEKETFLKYARELDEIIDKI